MLDIKELVRKAVQDGINNTRIIEILTDYMDDCSSKTESYLKLYNEIYGDKLCDKFCIKLVEGLSNSKEHGKKWTLEQTNEIARKIGISFNHDEYSEYEFWAAMHLEYYTHCDTLEESNISDPIIFGKLGDDYLDTKGLLKAYFFFVEMNKEN